MTSGWPSAALNGSLIARISESELPPAANGTNKVIGLVGHSCASATSEEPDSIAIASRPDIDVRDRIEPLMRSAMRNRRLVVGADRRHGSGPALHLDQHR